MHGVLDVPVPEVVLNRPGVVALVRELEAAGVAEHVRVDRKAEPRGSTRPRDDLTNGRIGQRPPSLRGEDVGRRWIVALHAPKGPELGATERVRRRHAVLEPCDVHEALAQVELIPTQRDQLADAEAMPIAEQDERRVAVAMPAGAAGAAVT